MKATNIKELKKRYAKLGYELFYNRTEQAWFYRKHGTTLEWRIGTSEALEYQIETLEQF